MQSMQTQAIPLPFPKYCQIVQKALRERDGETLAVLLANDQQEIGERIILGLAGSHRNLLVPHTLKLPSPFSEIVISHIQVLVLSKQASSSLGETEGASWVGAYKEQVQCLSLFMNQFLINQTSWPLPVLYQLCRDLRDLGEKADEYSISSGLQKTPVSLEDTARHINKAFTIVATDRMNKGVEARQRGIYYIAGLSIKCYFKVNRPTLCKNIIRAIGSSSNPQPLDSFPIAHQVTWRYYMGMLAFLEEEYKTAEDLFWEAFKGCSWLAKRNLEQILFYLLPLRLLRGLLPSPILLSQFPVLSDTYLPFIQALRRSDIRAYDIALRALRGKLLSLSGGGGGGGGGIWTAMEKGREVVVRGRLKKIWLAQNKLSRIPIKTFQIGLQLASGSSSLSASTPTPIPSRVEDGSFGDLEDEEEYADPAEVECLIANMIYKGYVKGYISHGHQIVVLSAKSAFPPLGGP
ncbi:Transcription-associated recombination protein-Thp1p [Phaffia rhodozyma]|uniref:Transcription-associated recombination protein-Thp1p n=1 Tax=Phaffia rhodozyma TaxID=264483 RepID=A0A0F7SNZ9_PHARH|nr:Transcription-associated recombination protein-Thp1p [Phaffia rhodozyma]